MTSRRAVMIKLSFSRLKAPLAVAGYGGLAFAVLGAVLSLLCKLKTGPTHLERTHPVKATG